MKQCHFRLKDWVFSICYRDHFSKHSVSSFTLASSSNCFSTLRNKLQPEQHSVEMSKECSRVHPPAPVHHTDPSPNNIKTVDLIKWTLTPPQFPLVRKNLQKIFLKPEREIFLGANCSLLEPSTSGLPRNCKISHFFISNGQIICTFWHYMLWGFLT